MYYKYTCYCIPMKCIYFIYTLIYVYGMCWLIFSATDDKKSYVNLIKKQDVPFEISCSLFIINLFVGGALGFNTCILQKSGFENESNLDRDDIRVMKIYQIIFIMCGLFTFIIHIEYIRWPVTYAITCMYTIALVHWSDNIRSTKELIEQLDKHKKSSVIKDEYIEII